MAQQINPCKCGSKKKPDLDSDDIILQVRILS